LHRTKKRPHEGAELGMMLALWLTVVPVSLGGRFYAHYFIEFAPPLALMAAPTALTLLDVGPRLGLGKTRLLAAGLLFPVVLHAPTALGRFLAGDSPAQEQKPRPVAAWIREHPPEPARLFVWGHYTPIYYLSERTPGTRYINTSVHMGDFDPKHL